MRNQRHFSDFSTIAAIATPPGCGGIGIIRVSGGKASLVAQAILKRDLEPRKVHHTNFYSLENEIIDHGIALFFRGPHSFTGEDVLELQGHGGVVILDTVLKNILKIDDVRLATPGEFSKRAFLNGKLDLVQAEAVADLINASSSQAAKLAMKSLQGVFSKNVHDLVDLLIQLRMLVESAIDFPEEEIDFLNQHQVARQLEKIVDQLNQVFRSAQQGSIHQEGITVAIAGKPNVGKSSLLNQLTGEETAIVTEIPGTTRDVLRERIVIDGLPVHIIDTAGLRKTKNIIEKEGIKRAWAEILKADNILLMIDDSSDYPECFTSFEKDFFRQLGLKTDQNIIFVKNKIDLTGEKPRIDQKDGKTFVYLSAKTGKGIDLLKEILKTGAHFSEGEALFIARRRHIQSLDQAKHFLSSAQRQLSHQMFELIAEDLKQAQNALSEITGEFAPDDLLDKIFSEFCVGK